MACVSSKAVAPEPNRLATADSPGPDIEQDIQLALAFLNTRDVETNTETLDDQGTWQRWCHEHALGEAPEAGAARGIRDAMRAAVPCEDGLDPTVTPAWPAQITLVGGIPVLTGVDALGSVLAAATRLVNTGHWGRIKICPAQDCLAAFYDRSRNRSRTWCSMRVCGNREKARSWRERHTTA